MIESFSGACSSQTASQGNSFNALVQMSVDVTAVLCKKDRNAPINPDHQDVNTSKTLLQSQKAARSPNTPGVIWQCTLSPDTSAGAAAASSKVRNRWYLILCQCRHKPLEHVFCKKLREYYAVIALHFSIRGCTKSAPHSYPEIRHPKAQTLFVLIVTNRRRSSQSKCSQIQLH
jgi:hypothetical protein